MLLDPARHLRDARLPGGDPHLRFWFRLVLPAHGARALSGRMLPQLDELVSAPAFDAAAVGWWWGKARETRDAGLRDVDPELDAVAVDDDGNVIAVAPCRWTAGEMGLQEKRRLDVLAARLSPDGPAPRQFLLSRGGLAPELARAAQVRLVTPADL